MTSQAGKRIAIPKEALLEDFGVYSVMVQVTGESFEKREVRVGKRNSEWIEILSGLKQDDIIVSKGVYQVKMASMSGEAPPHGHEH